VTSLFTVVPLAVLGAGIAGIAAAFGAFAGPGGQFGGPSSDAEVTAGAVGLLVGIAMLPIATQTVWRAAIAAVLGEPATVGSILQQVARTYWRLWGLTLGYTALIIVALLLFVTCLLLPLGLWLLVKWSLVLPAWFVERQRLGAALSRSWELTKANWWRLFGILLLFYVLQFAVSAALSSFAALSALVPSDWAGTTLAVQVIVRIGFSAVLAPLYPLVLTLLYFDLRVRHEHLDLEMLAREVGGGRPWELPPPPGMGPAYS
jgi:hypothetical protein